MFKDAEILFFGYLLCAFVYFLFWSLLMHEKFKRFAQETLNNAIAVYDQYAYFYGIGKKRARVYAYFTTWSIILSLALIWPKTLYHDIKDGFHTKGL